MKSLKREVLETLFLIIFMIIFVMALKPSENHSKEILDLQQRVNQLEKNILIIHQERCKCPTSTEEALQYKHMFDKKIKINGQEYFIDPD
jgi:hypothetical protein